MKKSTFIVLLALWCGASFSLSEAPVESSTEAEISITILPTSDSSDLGLSEPLQYALGQLFQETGVLKVQLSGYSIPGFTRDEVIQAFNIVQSDLISFSFMEKERLSVFLFAKDHPKEFIVSFRSLTDAPNGTLTSELIEARLREAVNDVLASYNGGAYQPLPSVDSNSIALGEEEHQQRAQEARILFRELTAIEKRKWYVGANIGMARYSDVQTGHAVANSAVNVGGVGGRKLDENFSLEMGFDVFSYIVLHSDIRYHIPFLEKYVDISATGGFGSVLAAITENKRSPSDSTSTITGSFLLGPGLGFDVPILGAKVRGEVRYYLGSTSILVGTYGVVVAL